MARIRTTKPEFWTSEQVVECSPIARLLFIGIWNFCDDHGLHPASVKRLKMEVFPSDTLDDSAIQSMVDELESAKLLHSYSVNGDRYWQVTGWAKHQKIEKPTYRHPLPQDASAPQNSPPPPRVVVEKSPPPRPRNGMESKGSKEMSGKPDAIGVLDYLNTQAGKNYKPVKANLSLITARLGEATVEECRAVIDAKVQEWQHDPKMSTYLRPETLFGAVKFAGYLGQLSAGSTTGARDWL
ncbi:MAG: conserved phage C-terminal domain-containing protein [Pseudomonadota bacterium]|nr:conserved phage C-terminal domain-containing protein [Pseudomonadota bacterium]